MGEKEGDHVLFYHWYNITVHFVENILKSDYREYVYCNLKSIHMVRCVWCPIAHCYKCLDLQTLIVWNPWRFPRLTTVYFPGKETPWDYEANFRFCETLDLSITLSCLLQHNRNKLKTTVVAYLCIKNTYNYLDVNVVKKICNLLVNSWSDKYLENDWCLENKKKIKI